MQMKNLLVEDDMVTITAKMEFSCKMVLLGDNDVELGEGDWPGQGDVAQHAGWVGTVQVGGQQQPPVAQPCQVASAGGSLHAGGQNVPGQAG